MTKKTWAKAVMYCRKGETVGPDAAVTHLVGEAWVEGHWVHFRPEGGGREMSVGAHVVQRIEWLDGDGGPG
ncbi:hypothetical protein [Streptacidiphilus sp. ASG 303]|uniref:hypothetical protein n=1 Tax=Streptomycetaceae TaxID=2062 RepID=UPI001E2AED8B|nr:hypothetical protein [Streptacidiphilus sp. ASG 303]MCD0480883.1 hypothetical protein [Streptacidiphilus sp. ASG 303]